ncbi:MAG: hypothetical protein ABI448_06300 [Bacteroidia bacterium]
MEYIDLKEKLEKLLTEDLSNRNTLQDTRRNLFLNSEGAKTQQLLVSQKDIEINSLNLLVEKKKSILQLKDDEIEVLKNQLQEANQKLVDAEAAHQLEKESISAQLQDTEELSKLSIANEEYTAKIRELIYFVDKQNAEIESLQTDLASQSENNLVAMSLLTEKLELVSHAERSLKQLVAAQNVEIENHHTALSSLKNEAEEITIGWQQQQEQLILDNATLQADLSLLNQQYLDFQLETEAKSEIKVEDETEVEFTFENLIKSVEIENEHQSYEVEAVKHELEVIFQQRDEKMMLLQSEISSLQAQIALLQEDILAETEEKHSLSSQLSELTSIVSQKENQLNSPVDETVYQSNETLSNLTQVVENQKNAISNLEHTNKNIKLAQTLMLQVKDKTAAKQAINELVREIEQCIALLSE